MDGLAAGHDAATQMIDTSVVRVHQHGACISDNNRGSDRRNAAAAPEPRLSSRPAKFAPQR
jgi:hypothetical protein